MYTGLLEIWNYLNLKDEEKNADAIFVLGGSSLAPVHKAAEIYQKGISKIICCISIGGKFGGEKIWGMPESQKYRSILISLGIPPNAILSAEISTNTLEEARQAIPFLRKFVPGLKTLILVSRPLHQRRAYATFTKQHPEIDYINLPADEKFENSDTTAIRLIQEIERLQQYGEKGDLKNQQIPENILSLSYNIKQLLIQKGIYQE